MVIGATTPGNSTVLRTGMMIRASVESHGAGIGAIFVDWRHGHPQADFDRAQHDASVHREAADGVTSLGQQNATLEPALRQLEAVDCGVAQLDRQHTAAADHQDAVIDHGFDAPDRRRAAPPE